MLRLGASFYFSFSFFSPLLPVLFWFFFPAFCCFPEGAKTLETHPPPPHKKHLFFFSSPLFPFSTEFRPSPPERRLFGGKRNDLGSLTLRRQAEPTERYSRSLVTLEWAFGGGGFFPVSRGFNRKKGGVGATATAPATTRAPPPPQTPRVPPKRAGGGPHRCRSPAPAPPVPPTFRGALGCFFFPEIP